jgi:hypothetical protein
MHRKIQKFREMVRDHNWIRFMPRHVLILSSDTFVDFWSRKSWEFLSKGPEVGTELCGVKLQSCRRQENCLKFDWIGMT